jgi:NAD(P)-dependent dehydrogenase (short-subunit alcohol dehydrogenase family)
MAELDGKVALITGGASGIGRASALRFAAAGARVVLADLHAAAMARVVAAVGDDRALAVATDVTEEAQVEACVRRAVAHFGRLDIGLFAAGGAGTGPVHELDGDVFDRVLRLNLYGVFYALKHVARQLVAQGGGGALIAITSLNARQAGEGLAAYSASKAAVAMLLQSAALELGRFGIRANSIGPGLVETPLSAPLWQTPAIRDAFVAETPLGRHGRPEEVAALALYLASDAGSYMTGQVVSVDGGLTVH